jgi:hypothetical protein
MEFAVIAAKADDSYVLDISQDMGVFVYIRETKGGDEQIEY